MLNRRVIQVLSGILALLVILELSYFFARFIPAPVPLIALLQLLVVFFALGRIPDGIRVLAQFFLRHLSLFFVPAVIGVGLYWSELHPFLSALGLTLIVSTPLSMLITAALAERKGIQDD